MKSKVAEYVEDVTDRLPDADTVASVVNEYGGSTERPQPRLYEIAEIDDGSVELTEGAQTQYEEDLHSGDVKILDVDEENGVIIGEYHPDEESLGEVAAEGYQLFKGLNRGQMPWADKKSRTKTRKSKSGESGFMKMAAEHAAAHAVGAGAYDKIRQQVSG
ncbi:MAG: hypothetical protein ABEI97_00065 [Candidatus Nanohaloarchaea archaeon]